MPAPEPSSQTKQRLLAEAERRYLQRGVFGVTAREIYTAAGLSQGSFTYAFPAGLAEVHGTLFLTMHAAIWDPVLAVFQSAGRTAKAGLHEARTRLASALEQDVGRTRLYFQLQATIGVAPCHQAIWDRLRHDRAVLQPLARKCGLPAGAPGLEAMFGLLLVAAQSWAAGLHDVPPSACVAAMENQRASRAPNRQDQLMMGYLHDWRQKSLA